MPSTRSLYLPLLLVGLLVMLVVPVSASTTIIINCSRDGALLNNPADAATPWQPNLRDGATATTVTDPLAAGSTFFGGQTKTTTTDQGFDLHNRGIIAFPSYLIPDGATLLSATVYVFSQGGQSNTLTTVNASIIDAYPASYTDFVAGDYDGTTFTRQAADIPYASVPAANGTVAFPLTNLTFINKTGYTAYILTHNFDVDNISFGWISNKVANFAYRSNAYTGYPYAPINMTVTYEIPPEDMSVSIYPYSPDNTTKILPTTSLTLPVGTTVNITAAKGEFEPGTFILRGHGYPDIPTGINVTPSDLTFGGYTIPASAIDTKLVKAWYQSISSTYEDTPTWTQRWTLVPELLLNDDALVVVGVENQTNWLRIHNDTYDGYVKISNSTDTVPIDATWDDAATLQPFTLPQNENKQVWVTVHVPEDQEAGEYTGTLAITNDTGASLGDVTLNVNVLPTALQNSTLSYGLYYNGRLNYAGGIQYQDLYKTSAMYQIDLQKMYDHGVMYPTDYQLSTLGDSINQSFYIRDSIGFPKDKIFAQTDQGIGKYGGSGWYVPTWDSANISILMTALNLTKSNATQYGIDKVYLYAKDESTLSQLNEQIPAFNIIHDNGSYVYAALNAENASELGAEYIDWVNYIPPLNTTKVAVYHANGHQLASYANPQAGNENYTVYRQNYGFSLLNAGYDGAMDWAFQATHGTHSWNDWDGVVSEGYRDENFVYPTSSGGVNTIEFEGYREAIDDTRYMATVDHAVGNTTLSSSIVSAGIAAGNSSQSIRQQLIDVLQTLDGAVIPTASFTQDRPLVRIPQLVTVNDTSTNTPTMWNWSWGDGQWTNGTDANPTHRYSRPGLFTITLVATNAAGSDTATSRIWVYAPQKVVPGIQESEYVSCDDLTYTTSRELTSLERIMTDAKIAALCQ